MTISRQDLIVAIIVFALLSLAFSWPLVLHLGEQIPASYQPVDPMHIMYGLTTGAKNLTSNPFNFFDATFLYPNPHPLAFLDQIFFLCVMAAPVLLISGNMLLSYNVVWLLTFVLSGIGAWCLVGYLTRNHAAAYLGGILYAFFPLRFHSVGILHVLAMMGIPFALLMLHLWSHSREQKYLYWFTAISVAQFLCSGYTGVFLILCAVVYLIVLFITQRQDTVSLIKYHRKAFLKAAVGALVVLTPLVYPTVKNLSERPEGRSLGAAALFSALPEDFITPAPGSVLSPLAPYRDSARHPLFPGVVAVALTAIWVVKRGWKKHQYRADMLFYLVLSVVGLVLAFGPALGDPENRIPLPFALAYYILPGAALVRAPVRFIFLSSLAISVMAGAGLARGRQGLLAGVLVILAAAELWAGSLVLFNPLANGTPSIYDRIKDADPPVAILDLPMPRTEEEESNQDYARYQLYSLDHGQRLVNGICAYVPSLTRELREELQRFPHPVTVERLQEMGVRYVFLRRDQYSSLGFEVIEDAVRANPALSGVEERDGIWMVEVSPP